MCSAPRQADVLRSCSGVSNRGWWHGKHLECISKHIACHHCDLLCAPNAFVMSACTCPEPSRMRSPISALAFKLSPTDLKHCYAKNDIQVAVGELELILFQHICLARMQQCLGIMVFLCCTQVTLYKQHMRCDKRIKRIEPVLFCNESTGVAQI